MFKLKLINQNFSIKYKSIQDLGFSSLRPQQTTLLVIFGTSFVTPADSHGQA